MTDDVSTLPAWPERLTYPVKAHEVIPFWVAEADAALARMEALVEYVQHADDCEKWDPENEGLSDTLQCTCGLSELLAACERKEAGR